MVLQLLVNHYNESEEIVRRFLDSVEQQQGIDHNDIGILLYSDGDTNVLDSEFLNSFSFPITYKVLPHRGVCATRNALMDDAEADYLMFCDVDDMFHSSLGLYRLIKAIRDTEVNVIGSTYDCEYYDHDRLAYKTKQMDTIRVHGKVFKRSYLIENGIRFPDEMPFSGDMYFLWLAYNLKPKCVWIRESFYVWKYNENSVTHAHAFHHLRTYPMLLKNYTLLAENLVERGLLGLRDELICSVCQMMYLNATNEEYMTGPEELILVAKRAMAEFARQYGSLYSTVSMEKQQMIYKENLRLRSEGKACRGLNGVAVWLSEIAELR